MSLKKKSQGTHKDFNGFSLRGGVEKSVYLVHFFPPPPRTKNQIFFRLTDKYRVLIFLIKSQLKLNKDYSSKR